MAEISDAFVAAFLKALWEGADTDKRSTNYMIGRAIGDALEAIDAGRKHLHFHPPSDSVLNAVGDTILIEPVSVAAARQRHDESGSGKSPRCIICGQEFAVVGSPHCCGGRPDRAEPSTSTTR
jgi:hypothetical protein